MITDSKLSTYKEKTKDEQAKIDKYIKDMMAALQNYTLEGFMPYYEEYYLYVVAGYEIDQLWLKVYDTQEDLFAEYK